MECTGPEEERKVGSHIVDNPESVTLLVLDSDSHWVSIFLLEVEVGDFRRCRCISRDQMEIVLSASHLKYEMQIDCPSQVVVIQNLLAGTSP